MIWWIVGGLMMTLIVPWSLCTATSEEILEKWREENEDVSSDVDLRR